MGTEIKGNILCKIVLYIAKYIFRPNLKERLPEFLSLLHGVANKKTSLKIFEVLLRYVVQATGEFDENDIKSIIKETEIGEDIMQTFIDKYIEQGVQQGQMRLFVRQLEACFGRLPRWVYSKIEQADTTTLDEWGIRLLKANSL